MGNKSKIESSTTHSRSQPFKPHQFKKTKISEGLEELSSSINKFGSVTRKPNYDELRIPIKLIRASNLCKPSSFCVDEDADSKRAAAYGLSAHEGQQKRWNQNSEFKHSRTPVTSERPSEGRMERVSSTFNTESHLSPILDP
ncbi:hypothetical protein PM082_007013 [Marasmius tenuissimus]|nr:hypothetical protein PM082_007013 [Marasmius tenuissimus]